MNFDDRIRYKEVLPFLFLYTIQLDDWQAVDAESGGDFAAVMDVMFARPLLELAVRLYRLRPRIIRLDAGYWGLQLIHWIHATLGAVAVVPWNPKRQIVK